MEFYRGELEIIAVPQILRSAISSGTRPIILVALLFWIPALRAQEVPDSIALVAQPSESRLVWVNTATGIYHCSGTRWYGKTKQGEFMSEAEARAKGGCVATL